MTVRHIMLSLVSIACCILDFPAMKRMMLNEFFLGDFLHATCKALPASDKK